MSWQKESVMDQKLLFIKMWESGYYYMSTLCEHFKISRPTGYRLIHKYFDEGEDSLKVLSRAPINIPHKTPKIMWKYINQIQRAFARDICL